MKFQKIFFCLFFSFLFIELFSVNAWAENIFEYYFIPKQTEESDNNTAEVKDFFEALPDDIKERLPSDIAEEPLDEIVNSATDYTNFSTILNEIISGIASAMFPTLKATAVVFGIILISGLINLFKKNISSSETGKLTESVINIGIILSIVSTEIVTIGIIEEFTTLICGLMNGMLPVFGVVYTVSGNGSTAAIQSGGIMLLVTLCQNLFSYILIPSVRICILLSIAGSIFPDIGLKPITAAFKNIATGIMLVSVTLFSFVLGMQNSIAQSADSFGTRSLKFAIGQLVPIIGGAVSDSLGTIGGSLSLLKNAGGTIAIVAIIILLVPTIAGLAIRRVSIYLCKIFAAVLECSNVEKLLDDIGSIISMMLAFAVAISIAFIYMLTLFTGSVIAISA